MSSKRFLYLCVVLAILLSGVVTPPFQTQVVVAAVPPDAPSNVSPLGGATDVSLTPTLQSSAFTDPDLFDGHAASQWQIKTSSGDYSSPLFDSGRDKSNLTSIAIPSSTLNYSTTYYWHVRHQDTHRAWSSYSNDTSFTTVASPTAPPAVVTNDATSLGTDFARLNGNLISLGTAAGVNVSFQWGITSGLYTNETTSQSVTSTRSFYFYLSGLSPSTTYYFRAKATGDSIAYGSQMSFTTSASSNQSPGRPNNVSPANGATGVALTPTLQSSAFYDPDAGDTHAASQWQLRTASGSYSSPIHDSGTDTSLLTNMKAPALNYSTAYYWHVRHQDNHGAWSDYSAETSFTTRDATGPVISGVSATNIATTIATITWTTNEEATGQVEYGLTTSYGSTSTLDSNLVTSHSVKLSGLSPFKTYHYRVKSVDGSRNSTTSADYTFTTATSDSTAPSKPVVTDDGATTTSVTQLHATWTSSDPESGIDEYQYAIGTTAGGAGVVGWTSTGTNTWVTKTGLKLTLGVTYYFSVKAKNGEGLSSDVGVSNGIVVSGEVTMQKDISQAGGKVQTADGKIIAEFPADAVVGTVTVTIKQITPPSGTSTPEGFRAGNAYFVIEVTNTSGIAVVTLSQPIIITVKYSEADTVAAGGDPNNLVLAYWDEAAKEWKARDTTINTSSKTLSATTTHLSTWAVFGRITSAGPRIAPWLRTLIVLFTVLAVGMVSLLAVRQLAKKE